MTDIGDFKTLPKTIKRLRLLSREHDTKVNLSVSGQKPSHFGDIYIRLLEASWAKIWLIFITIFCILNTIFASLYFTVAHLPWGSGISNARPSFFEDYFFFSVQTFATIGYGGMAPYGLASNVLVAIEALFGLGIYALLTGIVYSRFSRPTARITFSDKAVINADNGSPHLSMRLINDRGNRIVEAKATMMLLRDEIMADASTIRRYHDLKLVRSNIPMLQLSWSLYHKIDKNSPIYQYTNKDLCDNNAEIIVSITGIDETLSSPIHARFSYVSEEIHINESFVDIIERRENNAITLHHDRLHLTKPVTNTLQTKTLKE